MKKFKKIMAVLVAALMIAATMVPAWATGIAYENRQPTVFIKIQRTTATYDPDSSSTPRALSYIKVFDAVFANNGLDASNADTDARETMTTTPADAKVAYTLANNDSWVGVLWDTSTRSRKTGNDWFDLELSADGSRYNVKLVTDSMNTATKRQDAAKWLWDKKPTAGTELPWVEAQSAYYKDGLTPGYYIIHSSDSGEWLIAATGDVTGYEKNTYPTIDKKQAEHATTHEDSDFGDSTLNVEIGDTIDYSIAITTPETADPNITIVDTLSTGLTKNNDQTIEYYDDSTSKWEELDTTVYTSSVAGQVTTIVLKCVTDATATATNLSDRVYNEEVRGKRIRIRYTAVVNGSATTDPTTSGKKNAVQLTYGSYSTSDEVTYKIYTSGVVKYDGDTATDTAGVLAAKPSGGTITYLQNAQFKLQRKLKSATDYSDYPVVKDGDYYRPKKLSTDGDPVNMYTNANGQIIIRGLDADYDYQVVEVQAPVGYLLQTTSTELTLQEDKVSTVTYDQSQNTTDEAKVVGTTLYLTPAQAAKVPNIAGRALPSTGGMGTTVLYIVGGMLVILAGAYLFFSRKRTA